MQILKWKHKHGTDMYDASTPEKLEASARKILHTLVSWGYIYKPDDEPDFRYSHIDMELVNLTDEQVNALPTSSLRDEAKKHKQKYDNVISQHSAEVADYELIQKIVAGEELYRPDWIQREDSRDGKRKAGDVVKGPRITAWRILQDRNGAEYENFELDDVIDPDKD